MLLKGFTKNTFGYLKIFAWLMNFDGRRCFNDQSNLVTFGL